MIVAILPVAVLGYRSRHVYSDQLNLLVTEGTLSRQDADYQAHEMEEQAIVYTLGGLIIALVLGYFFSRSLVRPIRNLEQGARKIGDGDLEYRIESGAMGELGELAITINQMAGSLQASQEEVSHRNRDLSILYEVAHSMAESRELNELLSSVLDKAMEITGSKTGCVLLQRDGGGLEPVVCRSGRQGKGDKPDTVIFDRAAAVATRSGEPAVFDYRGNGDLDGQVSLDAIACVPLKFESLLQGAICVTGARQNYPRETLDLMSAIGSEVAVAIENTRLFEKLESQNQELAMATGELADLISRAERQKSFGIRYQNPNLVRCWEFKDCQSLECLAYGLTENLRCWQVAGTHCGGKVQGVFAQKLGRCEQCEVFGTACPDKITHLGETFNNMMAVLERRVDEQEELQRQLFSSSKLAAGVAHEINNPLTGILGSALLMKSRQLDPEEREKKLDVIESEALRARDIVRNLLDFAHHGGNLNPVPVSLTQLLEHTLFLVRHQADLGAVEVKTDFQEGMPDIAVDANQMKQVFLNIIHNAIQAMPDGGRLSIKTRRKTTAGERRLLEISFNDSGSGMEAKAMERIFDPFFTTKRIGEGTGLGLSVSQRIVNEHGGEITVASEQGRGSIFTVVLPATGSSSEERQNVA